MRIKITQFPGGCLKTYLRNMMKQDRLNSCMLVHCHKTLADTITSKKRTKEVAFWEVQVNFNLFN